MTSPSSIILGLFELTENPQVFESENLRDMLAVLRRPIAEVRPGLNSLKILAALIVATLQAKRTMLDFLKTIKPLQRPYRHDTAPHLDSAQYIPLLTRAKTVGFLEYFCVRLSSNTWATWDGGEFE